jgi:hypothetical protein
VRKFSIKLDSFVVSDVEAVGDEAGYRSRNAHDSVGVDFVVWRNKQDVLRVSADHIIYVMISDDDGDDNGSTLS